MPAVPDGSPSSFDLVSNGGIFGQFRGLAELFPERIIDSPISDTAIVGTGVGAALTGMRPIIDMHFADFVTTAMDEIVNQMAKMKYMYGGNARLPIVVRCTCGGGFSAAAQHSQSNEAMFMHVPGLMRFGSELTLAWFSALTGVKSLRLFMPVILGAVIQGLIWSLFLYPLGGPMARILEFLGTSSEFFGAQPSEAFAWPPVAQTARPWAYWWWMGSEMLSADYADFTDFIVRRGRGFV